MVGKTCIGLESLLNVFVWSSSFDVLNSVLVVVLSKEVVGIPLLKVGLQSRSLSGRHVSTGFLDPVLGAMMKVCWHSRRSKAYRGLPEARMAGATVEETAFEDVNMWQAPVSQKPPLMRT